MTIPITFGTTSIIPPETPDLPGSPTCKSQAKQYKRKLVTKKQTKKGMKIFLCVYSNIYLSQCNVPVLLSSSELVFS